MEKDLVRVVIDSRTTVYVDRKKYHEKFREEYIEKRDRAQKDRIAQATTNLKIFRK